MDDQTAADVRTLMDRVIGHPPVSVKVMTEAFDRLMTALPPLEDRGGGADTREDSDTERRDEVHDSEFSTPPVSDTGDPLAGAANPPPHLVHLRDCPQPPDHLGPCFPNEHADDPDG